MKHSVQIRAFCAPASRDIDPGSGGRSWPHVHESDVSRAADVLARCPALGSWSPSPASRSGTIRQLIQRGSSLRSRDLGGMRLARYDYRMITVWFLQNLGMAVPAPSRRTPGKGGAGMPGSIADIMAVLIAAMSGSSSGCSCATARALLRRPCTSTGSWSRTTSQRRPCVRMMCPPRPAKRCPSRTGHTEAGTGPREVRLVSARLEARCLHHDPCRAPNLEVHRSGRKDHEQ
jgi:hypothetical protein